jgi:hypothetical protein
MERYICDFCHREVMEPSFVYFRDSEYKFIKYTICTKCNSKVSNILKALVEGVSE